MTFERIRRYAMLAIPAVALMACSSSEETTAFTGAINPGNGLPFGQNGRVFNASSGNAFRGAFLGKPFTAGGSEARWTNNTSTAINRDAQVTIISETAIQVAQNGSTWLFRNTGVNQDPTDPTSPQLWLAEAGTDGNPSTLSAVFGQGDASTNLQSIFFGQIQTPAASLTGITNSGSDMFLISGFETRPAEIEALSASARYSGAAQILARTASDDVAGALLNGTFDVDINYAVQNNPVSGSITGIADAKFGGGTVDLTLLSGGAIQAGDNSFTTGFSKTGGSNTAITGFSSTTVNGTLYGQDAGEIGLLMSGTATVAGTGSVAVTGFGRGPKQ